MPSLRSRRVVLPEGERAATIRHHDGVITEIGEGIADDDYGDLVILPGLVDTHVHVNDPGRTEWEGFATATAAAAAGGTTTIVDMPLNSVPPTVDVDALLAKQQAAAPHLNVDVAFWGGVVPGSQSAIAALVERGVCGFKVFLVDSGVPEFPPVSPDDLGPVMSGLARLGVPLLVHAEDPTELEVPNGDVRRYGTYLESRPARAEASAIDTMSDLARATSAHTHVLHVSSIEAVDAIRRGRESTAMTAETCPHYLTFDAADIPDGATLFKCAPPIRGSEHREALWSALAEGAVDMVVSDHSPAPVGLKDPREGNFVAAWGGIASLELRLLATWHGARQRGHGMDRLAAWLAGAPARLAGLDRRKGAIVEGHDADFVVFDPEGTTTVDAGRLKQRHPATPYDGMRLAGRIVATLLGGVPAGRRGGRLLTRGG